MGTHPMRVVQSRCMRVVQSPYQYLAGYLLVAPIDGAPPPLTIVSTSFRRPLSSMGGSLAVLLDAEMENRAAL